MQSLTEQVLQASGGTLLIPLVVIFAAVSLTKGMFSLRRSRSQERREFLDLYNGHEDENDFWLTVAVRHMFGAHLPPALIRRLLAGAQPGRALLEVGQAWDFLDLDDASGQIVWRRRVLASPVRRRWTIRICTVLYFITAAAALWLGWLAVNDRMQGTALCLAWTYVIIFGGMALFFLAYGDNLRDAQKTALRWLQLT